MVDPKGLRSHINSSHLCEWLVHHASWSTRSYICVLRIHLIGSINICAAQWWHVLVVGICYTKTPFPGRVQKSFSTTNLTRTSAQATPLGGYTREVCHLYNNTTEVNWLQKLPGKIPIKFDTFMPVSKNIGRSALLQPFSSLSECSIRHSHSTEPQWVYLQR